MPRSTTPRNSTPDEPEDGADTTPVPRPTEQLPFLEASAPVAAPRADEPADPATPRPGFIRRHPLAIGIAAAAGPVGLVSGLTAWGVGSAVTASLTSSTTAAAPSTTAPVAGTGTRSQKFKQLAGGRVVVRATIDSISGSTWSLTTRTGATGTVTVGSSTQFGTRKAPATASSFAVGDSVIIVATPTSTEAGALSGTANRVVMAKTKAGAAQPTPTQSPAPTT